MVEAEEGEEVGLDEVGVAAWVADDLVRRANMVRDDNFSPMMQIKLSRALCPFTPIIFTAGHKLVCPFESFRQVWNLTNDRKYLHSKKRIDTW